MLGRCWNTMHGGELVNLSASLRAGFHRHHPEAQPLAIVVHEGQVQVVLGSSLIPDLRHDDNEPIRSVRVNRL